MAKQTLEIGEELLRAGISPRHVKRLRFELQCHLDAIMDELRDTGISGESAAMIARDRLGADRDLIHAYLSAPELQSWWRRCPWALVLAPSLCFVALFSGCIALLAAVFAHKPDVAVDVAALRAFGAGVTFFASWIAPIVAGYIALIIATQRRVYWLWPVLGLTCVAIVGGMTQLQLHWPPNAVSGFLTAGAGVSRDSLESVGLRAAVTVFAVLLPCLFRSTSLLTSMPR